MYHSILTNALSQTVNLVAFGININYHFFLTSAIRQTFLYK
jgi:hypothetical protein